MPFSSGPAFYVSPSGSDANPGTLDAPWQTLQKAFSTLQPGQIAYLREGTYGAFCTMTTFSRAGTAAAPITVQGYPGERAVLHGQIKLQGSYFRLSNIVAEGPTCGTWGAPTQQGDNLILTVLGSSHHIEIANSEIFHDGWHAGISVYGDDIYILNNYIHDNGGFNDPSQSNTAHGIYYHEGNRGIIANNLLEHNRAKGLSARATGNSVFVVNNTVVGNGRSGIDITENTHDWVVANNVVLNNGNVNDGWGINTNGSTGGASNIEANNVLWHNGVSGTNNWVNNVTAVNNLTADPLLVNPTNSIPSADHAGYSNDYRLASGSPALDFGSLTYALPIALGPACRPQSAGPDAGALER